MSYIQCTRICTTYRYYACARQPRADPGVGYSPPTLSFTVHQGGRVKISKLEQSKVLLIPSFHTLCGMTENLADVGTKSWVLATPLLFNYPSLVPSQVSYLESHQISH